MTTRYLRRYKRVSIPGIFDPNEPVPELLTYHERTVRQEVAAVADPWSLGDRRAHLGRAKFNELIAAFLKDWDR